MRSPWQLFAAERDAGIDLVAEEISKITKEKINATVKLIPIGISVRRIHSKRI